MQKTQINLATDYRVITDGRRYRVQSKCDNGWKTESETCWLWLAKRRVKTLREKEAQRRADATAVWEAVDA